ncbi:hypothetical protein PENTCL1PPCAC_3653, partial [Pristionchus entomophagus]
SPLTDFGEISSGESDGALGEEGQIDVSGDGRLSEIGSATGLHAELEILLGVLNGVLDELLELPLDVLETSDVSPGDVGSLDDRLTESRGSRLAEGELQRINKTQINRICFTLKFSIVTESELRTSASIVSSSRSINSIFSLIC